VTWPDSASSTSTADGTISAASSRRNGLPPAPAHTQTGSGPAYGYLWWVEASGQLFAGTAVPAGSFAAYGKGSQFLLVLPALDRVIALLADPERPAAADRATHRPKLAELVHHATRGAVPLSPGTELARR
jgi:hypothetical protein